MLRLLNTNRNFHLPKSGTKLTAFTERADRDTGAYLRCICSSQLPEQLDQPQFSAGVKGTYEGPPICLIVPCIFEFLINSDSAISWFVLQ